MYENNRTSDRIFRSVIFALILREVRGKFGINRLGAFWFIFEPLAHVAVLLFLITIVRQRTLPGVDVPVYLVTGIVPFLLFKNIVLKGMQAVSANQGLFAYKQIKPFDCILARTIVEISLMACIYGALVFVLGFWFGSNILIHKPLQWMGVMFVGIVFSFGLALCFCVLTEAMPELRTFIKILFMPLYFLSGVILPLWKLPPPLLALMTWNPFLHIIDTLRQTWIGNYPDLSVISMEIPSRLTVITLFIGLAVYRARRLKLIAI